MASLISTSWAGGGGLLEDITISMLYMYIVCRTFVEMYLYVSITYIGFYKLANVTISIYVCIKSKVRETITSRGEGVSLSHSLCMSSVVDTGA